MQKTVNLHQLKPPPPPYWQRLTTAGGILSPIQKRDWALVLNAKGIPYCIASLGGREHFYLPAFLLELARQELVAYSCENHQPQAHQKPRLYANRQWALLLLAPLVWQYGGQAGWWPQMAFLPMGEQWQTLGRLDGIEVVFHQQWWRLDTALTLHADAGHLVGNLFFGAIFICLLARLAGLGKAWLIAIGGGICGNGLSLVIHTASYASIGFSTSVFAIVGGISAYSVAWGSRQTLLAFGTAMGLLALLGSGGANSDYGAHICGLGCGFVIAWLLVYAPCARRLPGWLAALVAWGLAFGGWVWAIWKTPIN